METKHTKSEKRILSPDAIALLSMLPKGLTDEYQKKAFIVFGRTKAELAADELLEALIEVRNYSNAFDELPPRMKDFVLQAIKKATE